MSGIEKIRSVQSTAMNLKNKNMMANHDDHRADHGKKIKSKIAFSEILRQEMSRK